MEKSSQQPKHFLVLENSADDAFLIRRAFSSLPFCTAFVCRNVSEAKAYMNGAGMYADRLNFPLPDAVICDLRLDGEIGTEFLEWLRGLPEARDLPAYVLTGSGSREQMEAAKKLGASKVLKKPVQAQALERLLAELALSLCSQTAGFSRERAVSKTTRLRK